MSEILYKVWTPRLRPYSEIRTLLQILQGIPQKSVKSLIAAIAKQAGTPQRPVRWSDPSTWIAERLHDDEAQLAHFIWHESKQTVNPRYIDGARYMIDLYALLQPDAAGNYVLTAKGQGFLANDRATMQEIDDSEGILYLLTLLATNKHAKRGNLLSAWGDFLQTYSKFRTTSTTLDTLRLRLANIVERGLALRAGQRYQISPAGIAYLHAVESERGFHAVESERGFHAVESESQSLPLALHAGDKRGQLPYVEPVESESQRQALTLHAGEKRGQLPYVEPELASGSGGGRGGSVSSATHWETPLDLAMLLTYAEQQCTEAELEGWLRDEFQTLIGNAQDAVIWPKEPINVRDRLEMYQIVYLAPTWLDANPDPAQQAPALRRYIEECGSFPRQYRNNLSLAVPDGRMVQAARLAMRTLFAGDFLESQSAQWSLTEQQQDELTARINEAETALHTSLTHLYTTVYTPISDEPVGAMPTPNEPVGDTSTSDHPIGQLYTLEPLTIPSSSQEPLHRRIRAALHNRVVWESIQPSTIVSLAKLNEYAEIALQYESVGNIITGSFCYHAWPHVWDADVIRRAIALGVKQRLFAYVTDAYQEWQQPLLLTKPASACITFGTDLAWQELEMNASTYLVSPAYAQQLLTNTAATPLLRQRYTLNEHGEAKRLIPANAISSAQQLPMSVAPLEVAPTMPVSQSVAPAQENQSYVLTILSKKSADLHFVQQALEQLEKQGIALHITMHITTTSKTGQPVPRDLLHQLVTEPITEATHAEVIEEPIVEEY